jgi:hypothetical protein
MKKTAKKSSASTPKKPAKKSVKKSVEKPLKKVAVKSKSLPKKSKKASTRITTPVKPKASRGMNEFQQCVVLAAVINQKRNRDTQFQAIPLPDINSSALQPLRACLADYAFTANDISRAVTDLLSSKAFQQAFPVKNNAQKNLILVTETEPQALLEKMLELAGPEAKKTIFFIEGPHNIHKTTLEKYALKTAQIHPVALHHESSKLPSEDVLHKQMIMKMNLHNSSKYFENNSQRLSTKQRRGRG